MSPLVRLLDGFDIFLSLHLSMHGESVTPMDRNHWEGREPTDRYLINVEGEELKNELKARKFWAIKKLDRRSTRSVDSSQNGANGSCSEMEYLKQWREFVLDALTIHLEASSRDEELTWSCNFTSLYNHYSFSKSGNKFGDRCLSFDEFLFSKISLSINWCNSSQQGTGHQTKQWCLAWRRILKNMASKGCFLDHNAPKLFGDKLRTKSYLKDVETLMHWLTSKIGKKKIRNGLTTSSHDPNHPPFRTGGILDGALCKVFSISGLLVSLHECLRFYGKS